MEGLVRVAAAVPHLNLANVEANVRAHLDKLAEANACHAGLVVFPELSLTGYTCGDLFFQSTLLEAVERGLTVIREEMPEGLTAVVGAPLRVADGLYNCAVVIGRGRIYGAVCKTCLPNNGEFYEKRWFRSGRELLGEANVTADVGGQAVPVGSGLVFTTADGVTIGAELCEDLWSPLPPSTLLALNGAEIILNLSASNELIAKREYRQELIRQQSARCLCGYVYVSAGTGESTSDLVFSGHSMAAQCGGVLKENEAYLEDDYLLTADLDILRIRADRMKQTSFGDCVAAWRGGVRRITLPNAVCLPDSAAADLSVSKHPFIPADRASRQLRCEQIFAMQATALARRMTITGGKVVVGISGGLDSTLALLAACKAADQLGLPRTNILGVTMPCFGTTERTKNNAVLLAEHMGTTLRTIPIGDTVRSHFRDIGHDPEDQDVTYENAQARERTQVLMDVANQTGGLVIGTGDLSELALGWATYSGDHMSMYGVNASIPKTLVRHLVDYVARDNRKKDPELAQVLEDILDTPVSPELLPAVQGEISQRTEDLVGPYELHDFFLYHAVRWGFGPRKILRLAELALGRQYSREVILKWLKNFYYRFFAQQFKRSCLPDGPKVGSVSLSPRGDWRMPSDAVARLWLEELEGI